MTVLDQFHFKGNQEKAVTDSSSAIAVTAGAGSGKTLSLVGRYLHLLEQGYPIRSILAITFTEKAAREMRSRIREALIPHPNPLPKGEGTDSPPSRGEGTDSPPPQGEGTDSPPPQGEGTDSPPSRGEGTDSPPPQGEGTDSPPPQGEGTDSPPSRGEGTDSPPSRGEGTDSPPPQGEGTDSPPPQGEGTDSPPPQGEGTDSPPSRGEGTDSPPPVGEGLGVREIDSARIGTIHSLCAELLRAHPAEAALDPAFEVLEEGLASALQAEAIESSLAWAANDSPSAALFESFKENELRGILKSMLSRRLDVAPLLPVGEGQGIREQFSNSLSSHLATHLDSQPWNDSLSILNHHRSSSPEDKLELARQAVLAAWDEIQTSRAAQKWDEVLAGLTALRKSISTQGQKKNWDDIESIREAMKNLRGVYDEHLKFLAEKSRFALDEKLAASLPAVHRLFNQTLLEYNRLKADRLDFDDLEGLTAQLLTGHPEIRAQLQSELRAVLVDEFQDTNDRQRQIVYALTGFGTDSKVSRLSGVQSQETLDSKTNLFIVGDAKQSIYRFRQADVTVFRQVQRDIQSSGGELIDLDLTFRAHKPLLDSLNSLLSPILGDVDDPARPYAVPFAPLKAYRQKPECENIQPPFIEFHLGLGENAEEGRVAAAQALANRLRELHQNEGFAWGDMALLFRSSTAFEAYETALEKAGIPFVTVAGRGFYDRPEIRDLLNLLAAIADPTDDLALVGALRSPAFAIPDAEIYKLRFPNNSTAPAKIFETLSTQVDTYTGTQVNNGTRTTHHALNIHHSSFILHHLISLSSRAPAATVLKRLLDLTHYRAILSSAPNGARMIRNVEKLLADAHRSRLVNLADFLAYVQTLRDVGLREGEAPADASSAGAVQLMTVHKAKGLEFPLTVIADAAHQYHAHSARVQITNYQPPITNLLLDLRDDDFHSTAWQLAARLEEDRAEAEDNRLLYVAATRAKEKLLISGHVKPAKDGLSLKGWLAHFDFLNGISTPEPSLLPNGISASIYPSSQTDASASPQPDSAIDSPLPSGEGSGVRADSPLLPGEGSGVRSLLEPLTPPLPLADEKSRARESDPPQRVWRIVSKTKRPHAPAWLVGRLVHEALRRWRFDELDDFLKPFALESGLTDEEEIRAAVQESRRLLERLRAHPLFNELDSAERHHEVPYFSPEGRGYIDLLCRVNDNWIIIDFKTDDVRSDVEARAIIEQKEYNRQVERYARAIENQLQVKAKTRLVFLNVNGEVKVFDTDSNVS